MRWLDRLLARHEPAPLAAPVAEPPAEVATPPEPTIEAHRSAAIEEIVATARRRGGGLAALDLGIARPSTFAFLEPWTRVFRVVDLEAGIGRGSAAEVRTLLPEPTAPWDLVLVWDLLDRLERPVAKQLAKRLETQLAAGAMIHLLASRTAEIDAEPPQIELGEVPMLTIRRVSPKRRPGPGWTQRELSTWLAGCEPGASALYKTGFVEMVLRRKG